MNRSTEFDITSPAFKVNPYPAFAELRTYDPVHLLSSSAGQNTWLVTRYRDVDFVLRDERFIKDKDKMLASAGPYHKAASSEDLFALGMSKFDPPDHTRLRLLVNPFFAPRRIELWASRIQQIADELIDAVEGKGSMDLIEEFAFPLPLTVILEMLGIPGEDSQRLHQWTRAIVDALDDPVAFQQVGKQLDDYHAYLVDLVERKHKEPADDLLSTWMQENAEGDRLSDREIVVMAFLLIMAGYQTTGTMISNGMLALMTHPVQMDLLRNSPELGKMAVEEFLRYQSPLMLGTFSWAREDVELGGRTICRGDLVLVALASANRDSAAFSVPDTLDITRQENTHLAFSRGAHYCLGAPLARLEGQIAFSTLLHRLPDMRLQISPDALIWRPGAMIQGLQYLPVSF